MIRPAVPRYFSTVRRLRSRFGSQLSDERRLLEFARPIFRRDLLGDAVRSPIRVPPDVIQLSADGKRLAIELSCQMGVWDLAASKQLVDYHAELPDGMMRSTDGRLFVAADLGVFRVWRLPR